MDLLLHFIEHALEDTLVLVPFLFVTYIARRIPRGWHISLSTLFCVVLTNIRSKILLWNW